MFFPNCTRNHTITYTNKTETIVYALYIHCKQCVNFTQFSSSCQNNFFGQREMLVIVGRIDYFRGFHTNPNSVSYKNIAYG